MRVQRMPQLQLVVVCLAATCGLLFGTCYAFEGGHRYDIASGIGDIYGLSEKSTDVLRCLALEQLFFARLAEDAAIIPSLQNYQFSDLSTPEKVSSYASQLLKEIRAEVIDTASTYAGGDDLWKLVTLLSLGLGAVQSFYSLSDYANTHPPKLCSCHRSDTLFAYLHDGTTPEVYTIDGAKGMCSASYKGSYGRKRFEGAYTYAFIASIEWVSAFKTWVEDDAICTVCWTHISQMSESKGHVTSDDMETITENLPYLVEMAMYNTRLYQNGHWKGSGSGSESLGAAAVKKYTGTRTKTELEKEYVTQIADKLYTMVPSSERDFSHLTPYKELSDVYSEMAMVVVRTGNFTSNVENVYARVQFLPDSLQVGLTGLDSTETVIIGKTASNVEWVSIYYINKAKYTKATIEYSLLKSDTETGGYEQGKGTVLDINPSGISEKLSESIRLDSSDPMVFGTIEGNYEDATSWATITNDQNTVTLYFTVKDVGAFGTPAVDNACVPGNSGTVVSYASCAQKYDLVTADEQNAIMEAICPRDSGPSVSTVEGIEITFVIMCSMVLTALVAALALKAYDRFNPGPHFLSKEKTNGTEVEGQMPAPSQGATPEPRGSKVRLLMRRLTGADIELDPEEKKPNLMDVLRQNTEVRLVPDDEPNSRHSTFDNGQTSVQLEPLKSSVK